MDARRNGLQVAHTGPEGYEPPFVELAIDARLDRGVTGQRLSPCVPPGGTVEDDTDEDQRARSTPPPTRRDP
jgi:hypothetical protein